MDISKVILEMIFCFLPKVKTQLESRFITCNIKICHLKVFMQCKPISHFKAMKACVIIPARYASTRFPGKPDPILGKPMILWVAELSAPAQTEDMRIAFAGFMPLMTSPLALTGTDRVAEASKNVSYDIYKVMSTDGYILHKCIKSHMLL